MKEVISFLKKLAENDDLRDFYGTRPVNGHRHRGWTSDLFSSQLKPELGGSPVNTCPHPY
jgi:hypothetical protein